MKVCTSTIEDLGKPKYWPPNTPPWLTKDDDMPEVPTSRKDESDE